MSLLPQGKCPHCHQCDDIPTCSDLRCLFCLCLRCLRGLTLCCLIKWLWALLRQFPCKKSPILVMHRHATSLLLDPIRRLKSQWAFKGKVQNVTHKDVGYTWKELLEFNLHRQESNMCRNGYQRCGIMVEGTLSCIRPNLLIWVY